MDRQIIHNMVEYIGQQRSFPFDVMDIEESLGDVLAFYGMHRSLSPDEEQAVKKELRKRALSMELAEMDRLAELGAYCHLTPVMAHLRPYRSWHHKQPSVPPGEFMQKLRQA